MTARATVRPARRCGLLAGLVLALTLIPPALAGNAESFFAMGMQAYAAEDYEKAIHLFEQAAAAEPNVSKYYHWLGRAAGRRAERAHFLRAPGLAKKARAAWERAVEIDPADIGALSDLLEYYLQAPGFLGGGEDKARAVAERLAKLNAAEGHRAQAVILARRKDYAGAEKEYRAALDLEPQRPGRLLELASFLSERGRYSESDALFDRVAQLAPGTPGLLFQRGKALALSKRDPREARQLLEAYLRSNRQADDPPPSEVQALLKRL
ncbi:MAG TPA: tetratricopeptide repeat protein [Bryobacterales bacterium]|nr:tetratricopeptide repeat protein [Bryobacterales bacterium]